MPCYFWILVSLLWVFSRSLKKRFSIYLSGKYYESAKPFFSLCLLYRDPYLYITIIFEIMDINLNSYRSLLYISAFYTYLLYICLITSLPQINNTKTLPRTLLCKSRIVDQSEENGRNTSTYYAETHSSIIDRQVSSSSP